MPDVLWEAEGGVWEATEEDEEEVVEEEEEEDEVEDWAAAARAAEPPKHRSRMHLAHFLPSSSRTSSTVAYWSTYLTESFRRFSHYTAEICLIIESLAYFISNSITIHSPH